MPSATTHTVPGHDVSRVIYLKLTHIHLSFGKVTEDLRICPYSTDHHLLLASCSNYVSSLQHFVDINTCFSDAVCLLEEVVFQSTPELLSLEDGGPAQMLRKTAPADKSGNVKTFFAEFRCRPTRHSASSSCTQSAHRDCLLICALETFLTRNHKHRRAVAKPAACAPNAVNTRVQWKEGGTVSYTHLTLPTIYSV